MKKLYSLLFSLLVIGGSALATPKISEENRMYGYGDAFIFVEGGVEFAIYPDGQFDFFFNSQRNGYNVNVVSPQVNISYNSGYNYDPFVQYDDFGAVIQIEHVPVFYDYYGRIIQAGNIYISYNNFGRIARIGGLRLHYNHYNHLSHYSGYINIHNRHYVHRPWHNYYTRPYAQYTIIHHQPYRAYYYPNRVTYNYHVNYYQQYYNDGYRRSYYRPGENVTSYHRGRRTAQVRDIRPQNLDSDYTSTIRDERRSTRSNSTSRSTKATVDTKQRRTTVNESDRARGRQARSSNEDSYISGNTRSTERQVTRAPQQRQRQVQATTNSRETSRETAINSRSRETRTSAPSARTQNRAATVQTPSRVSTPQPASSGSSRSTRGRGN